jgi:hypothetical protein
LDEKEVASLSLIDAVVHHTSLAQRPSQTKVEPSDGQQTSSSADGDRTTEAESEAKNKRDNAGTCR